MSGKKKGADLRALLPLFGALIVFGAFAALVLIVMKGREVRLERKFESEVTAAAERYGLDENLVFAVIRTESGFDPNAVSSANAKGLMQLMTDTAEWICWRRGETYEESRVFEPEYNIDLGCWLLRYLIDRFNGNLEYAAAAYNAGANRVEGWLNDPDRFENGELVIPFGETRNYVKKVMDYYEKYTKQAEKEAADS